MQTTKNIRLYDPKIQDRIFKYLKSKVTYKPKMLNLTKKSEFDEIKDNDYILCPEYEGVRSWIMFFRMEDCYYAVNFPKYNEGSGKKSAIYPADVMVHKDLYNGTIMEGVYYKSNDGNRYLVIDEIYMYCGQDQLLRSKQDRLEILSKCIKKFEQNFKFHIYPSLYYKIDKSQLSSLFSNICADEFIRNVIFYPSMIGRNIYRYTIIETDRKEDVVDVSSFIMQKTPNPDVYDLYKSSDSKKKLGIAYISDTAASKKWRAEFKESGKDKLTVKCNYVASKKKWQPIEVIKDKIVDKKFGEKKRLVEKDDKKEKVKEKPKEKVKEKMFDKIVKRTEVKTKVKAKVKEKVKGESKRKGTTEINTEENAQRKYVREITREI